MTPATAALMAQYNRWMNQRLYAAAATLSEADVQRDRGAFFGSIFGTLTHLVAADTLWLHRLARGLADTALTAALHPHPQPASLRPEIAPTLAELAQQRDALDDVIERWVASLTPAQMSAPLRYTNMAGQAHTRPLGALLQHVFNHQTHHRGQVTTLLFQAGVDVGVTDLLALIPTSD